MSKTFAQFQQDVSGTASALMTQMLCAERGMDYNQLQQMAQQSHLNNILQAEQERQMNQVINRHYQGSSFVNKVRDVFGGTQTNFLAPQPMPMAQPIMQPQIGYGMPMTQGNYSPQQVAQSFGQQPLIPEPQAAPALDMDSLRAMFAEVVAEMVPVQPQVQQYQQPQAQHLYHVPAPQQYQPSFAPPQPTPDYSQDTTVAGEQES